MTGPGDREWEDLAAAWRDEAGSRGTPSPDGLRKAVVAARREEILRVAIESVVAILLIAVILHMGRVHPTRAAERWASLGGFNVVALWALLMLNRIGAWRAFSATTEGYLTHAESRARRSLRAAWLLGPLLTGELALIGTWLGMEGLLFRADLEEWIVRGIVVVLIGLGLLASIRMRRTARATLRAIDNYRTEAGEQT